MNLLKKKLQGEWIFHNKMKPNVCFYGAVDRDAVGSGSGKIVPAPDPDLIFLYLKIR
jgi:hypothetical protein